MGWVVNARPRPLYSRKWPVPTVWEAGWSPGPVWTGTKYILSHRDFDPLTVASRHTDCDIPAHKSRRKVSDIFVQLLPNLSFVNGFSLKSPMAVQVNLPLRYTRHRQTDGMTNPAGAFSDPRNAPQHYRPTELHLLSNCFVMFFRKYSTTWQYFAVTKSPQKWVVTLLWQLHSVMATHVTVE